METPDFKLGDLVQLKRDVSDGVHEIVVLHKTAFAGVFTGATLRCAWAASGSTGETRQGDVFAVPIARIVPINPLILLALESEWSRSNSA